MPLTITEREIIRRRKPSGILVPLLEDLFKKPLEPEDEDDEKFILDLLRKRKLQDHERGHYSPSLLSECKRRVYFIRTGAERHTIPNIRAHGFFAEGNFKHLKWQFALWKLHRAGVIELVDDGIDPPGVEVLVKSKRKDFDGHVDGLFRIIKADEYHIADFKGINPRFFMQFQEGERPFDHYHEQLGGYGMMVNAGKQFPFIISRCLLVLENKAGPTERGSPLALHEEVVLVDAWKGNIQKKMKELRAYEEKEEIPPPECVSTKSFQFQGCPFSGRCLQEVKEIQRRIKDSKGGDSPKLNVAVPRKSRAGRARRSRRR